MANESNKDDGTHLLEMINDIKFAMLTTVDEGNLRSRPMTNLQGDTFDGALWFFTHASAPKVDEVQKQQQVNISFADPDKQNYVSVSGNAEIVRDRAKAEELWTPAMKTWFRGGIDDPELAMLKVTVTQAEFWDSPSNKMVRAFVFAKAAITGDYSGIGEDKKVTFS